MSAIRREKLATFYLTKVGNLETSHAFVQQFLCNLCSVKSKIIIYKPVCFISFSH